jgi:hypothetical protein
VSFLSQRGGDRPYRPRAQCAPYGRRLPMRRCRVKPRATWRGAPRSGDRRNGERLRGGDAGARKWTRDGSEPPAPPTRNGGKDRRSTQRTRRAQRPFLVGWAWPTRIGVSPSDPARVRSAHPTVLATDAMFVGWARPTRNGAPTSDPARVRSAHPTVGGYRSGVARVKQRATWRGAPRACPWGSTERHAGARRRGPACGDPTAEAGQARGVRAMTVLPCLGGLGARGVEEALGPAGERLRGGDAGAGKCTRTGSEPPAPPRRDGVPCVRAPAPAVHARHAPNRSRPPGCSARRARR